VGESGDGVGLDEPDVDDEGDGVIESAAARGLIPFEAAITATAHTSTVPMAAELITARRARM
jgi:hypothetical protein